MGEPRHLVLVGMMGAGKSTVGPRCAAALGVAFVDTDTLIATAAGASVAEVFARDGETRFRRLERAAVDEVCAAPGATVIAVGGGAVLDADNRRRLRGAGLVVWLRAPASQLALQVGDGRSRPLLHGDPEGALDRLVTQRKPAYEAAAHVTVDTEGRSVAAVTDAVLAAFAASSERVS